VAESVISIAGHQVYYNIEDKERHGIIKLITEKTPDGRWYYLSAFLHPDSGGAQGDMLDLALARHVRVTTHNVFHPIFELVEVKTRGRDAVKGFITSHDLNKNGNRTPYGIAFYDRNNPPMDVTKSAIAFCTMAASIAVSTSGERLAAVTSDSHARVPPKTYAPSQSYPDAEEWKGAVDSEVQSYHIPRQQRVAPYGQGGHPPGYEHRGQQVGADDQVQPRRVHRDVQGADGGEGLLAEGGPRLRGNVRASQPAHHHPHRADAHGHPWPVRAPYRRQDGLPQRVAGPRGVHAAPHRLRHRRQAVRPGAEEHYGLKHASHNWHKLQEKFILGHDARIKKSSTDPCLFYISLAGLFVLIDTYVDDYIIATNIADWYKRFATAFGTAFAIKELGVPSNMLQMALTWTKDSVTLSHHRFIKEVSLVFEEKTLSLY